MNKRQRLKQIKLGKLPKSEYTVRQAMELLGNYQLCFNPPQFVDKKDCPGCQHYEACAYLGKEQYRKVRA